MKFWRALERLPDGAVMLEWERELGDEFDAARPLLLLSQDLAKTYPCTNSAGCGVPHRVEEHGRDGRIALCDVDEWCPPIRIESADLLVLTVDKAKLCRRIAKALGFTEPMGRNGTGARADWIGTYGAANSGVFLMCPGDSMRMHREVERLFCAHPDPFVLFTPTGVHCSREVASALKRESCLHIPLAGALALNGPGGLTVRKSIQPMLDRFTQGLAEGKGLVKTVEQLHRNVELVAKDKYELRRENEELRRLHADGCLKFATRVRGEDFQAFAVIMALGNRNAAADFLKLPPRTFYDQVDKWQNGNRDYQRMFRLVEWRKAQGRKLKVRLEDSIAFGDSGGGTENPHTVEEVLTEMKDGAVDSRDYPALLRDLFELLASQNPQNWQGVRKEALEILSEEVPQ
jgi:hypothetical protein